MPTAEASSGKRVSDVYLPNVAYVVRQGSNPADQCATYQGTDAEVENKVILTQGQLSESQSQGRSVSTREMTSAPNRDEVRFAEKVKEPVSPAASECTSPERTSAFSGTVPHTKQENHVVLAIVKVGHRGNDASERLTKKGGHIVSLSLSEQAHEKKKCAKRACKHWEHLVPRTSVDSCLIHAFSEPDCSWQMRTETLPERAFASEYRVRERTRWNQRIFIIK